MRGKRDPRSRLFAATLALALLGGPSGATAGAAASRETGTTQATGQRRAIDKVVADYVGLYAAATLDRWKKLFHPQLTVTFPADDGTIRVRSLEEFFTAQRDYFATGRAIGERLENVRVDEGRRIARVSADFVFVDEGEESRGKLGLHLAEGKDGWRIVAIIFSYDP